MSTQTTNLGLTKPSGNEKPLVSVLNTDLDIIDEAVGDVDVQADGSLQDQIDALGESVSHIYHPNRPDKSDLCLVDLNDPHHAYNQPHRVRAEDVTTLISRPSALTSGAFYALWDCDFIATYGDNHAQLLITMREMAPKPGRIWTNWYNYTSWKGWKSIELS